MLKKISALAGITLLGSSVLSLHAAPSKIYLLRHTEKLKFADKGTMLSPCGLAQAMAQQLPSTNHQVILNLENGANPSACKISSAGQILINPNTQKALFSMFLSAYMSGKSVV